MSSNHFVIRNGEIVCKSEVQKPVLMSTLKLNIMKPTLSLKNHNEEVNKLINEVSIEQIKRQHEAKIKIYEERVQQLERQLHQKNMFIENHIKNKRMVQGEYPKILNHKTSQILFRQQSSIQLLQDKVSKCGKSTLEDLKHVDSGKETSRTRASGKEYTHQRKQTYESMYDSQSYLPSINISFENLNNQISHQQISSSHINIFSLLGSVPQRQPLRDVKNSFDASTLLDRLNKSATLVKNIKKFLGPSHGIQEEKQNLGLQKIEYKCSAQNLIIQQEQQAQLQFFVEDLIGKHKQILKLIQYLQSSQQQQIKQVKQHYEDIIKKIESEKSLQSIETNMVRCPSNEENKENKKFKRTVECKNRTVEYKNKAVVWKNQNEQKTKNNRIQIEKLLKYSKIPLKNIIENEVGQWLQRESFEDNFSSHSNEQFF